MSNKDIEILKSMIEEYNACSIPEIDMQVNITFREKQAQAIENILEDRERLEEENKKNKDALEVLNKMKKKYKIALFMIIRNSIVLPKGIELQKSSKEISEMSYKTMCEVLTMIDFRTGEKMYEEGKLNGRT